MKPQVNAIANRLSLRAPLRESLEILDRVTDLIPLDHERDLIAALAAIREEFPSVEAFERDFPSLCFAIATGVGKTRLMGAFIAYLYRVRNIRHFFVLAPNLTIYNKMIGDFTAGTPKYVFQGLSEFALTPPEIITGDNYESGRGIRGATESRSGQLFGDAIHINVFNISKINSEVRGGATPRIKRLSEYIGESYFDYLAALPDLVLLMDESHRYRASAGVRAINELKPVLGLELTATPFIEGAGSRGRENFKNVIYSYPLSSAMEDGFVKEPAVATRENFNAANYTSDQLEDLKLRDGILIHENTKAELLEYSNGHDKPLVKPFMLVVAQDTTHADQLMAQIKADDFFGGRYAKKVITVHSNQRGEERDATIESLTAVESAAEPTEIVVHVNKLKEGWDVNNLYTIVPLRAAKSEILVEQTIGRGLRLPFGKRTGVAAVDRLTIVAHDKFQEIVDEANNPDSIIKAGVVIGRDIPEQGKEFVTVKSTFVEELERAATSAPETPGGAAAEHGTQERLQLSTPAAAEAAQATLRILETMGQRIPLTKLSDAATQQRITAAVEQTMRPAQPALDGTVEEKVEVAPIVAEIIARFIEHTIDIPRILVVPKSEVTCGFNDFDLDTSEIHLQPVAEDILIQSLPTSERTLLNRSNLPQEVRLEDYLVFELMNYDDISYDDHADLIYHLAGQVVTHARSYLKDEEEVSNVLRYHRRHLAALIHRQMLAHRWESKVEYEGIVRGRYDTVKSSQCSITQGETARNFRAPVAVRLNIRGMIFSGFKRSLTSTQKFDSDAERRFAVILEDDKDATLKWFRPAGGQVKIDFLEGQGYEPDFVVENSARKYLCEVKRNNEMEDDEVQAKARAAVRWCEFATAHETQHDGKPWSYLLIPDHAINASATLQGLAASYTQHL